PPGRLLVSPGFPSPGVQPTRGSAPLCVLQFLLHGQVQASRIAQRQTRRRAQGRVHPVPGGDSDGLRPGFLAVLRSDEVRQMTKRVDGRLPGQLRPIKTTMDYLATAEGSVLIEAGNTRVLCTASLEETVPGFLRNTGRGWVTAEYSMLPRATVTRTPREVN